MNKVDGVDLCRLSSVQGMHSLADAAAVVETSTVHWQNWGKPVDTDTFWLDSGGKQHQGNTVEYDTNIPDTRTAGGAGEHCSRGYSQALAGCSRLSAGYGSGFGAAQ